MKLLNVKWMVDLLYVCLDVFPHSLRLIKKKKVYTKHYTLNLLQNQPRFSRVLYKTKQLKMG